MIQRTIYLNPFRLRKIKRRLPKGLKETNPEYEKLVIKFIS